MTRGFYTLDSGILTQSRVLNTISNNIANSNTTGFKKAKVMTKTFGSMVIDRVNQTRTPIGSATLMNTVDETVTDYSQGSPEQTGRSLDFAINGDGFFGVQTDSGTVYTRGGSFNVDADGYLVLSGKGRVIGTNGAAIRPGTDNITSDEQGNIFTDGQKVGQIGVYSFADKSTLKTEGEGMYTGNNATPVTGAKILWKTVENSNVKMADEMTSAISSQRTFQSCSQALKMYDEILDKATTQIGKI